MTGQCWADPLSRAERRVLREKLARACKRFYSTRTVQTWDTNGDFSDNRASEAEVISRTLASAEMSDLHLDVTERAEAAS